MIDGRGTNKSIPLRIGDTVRIDGFAGWWRIVDVNLGGRLIVVGSRFHSVTAHGRSIAANEIVEWRRSP